jgi:hypothetical protein
MHTLGNNQREAVAIFSDHLEDLDHFIVLASFHSEEEDFMKNKPYKINAC